MSNACFLLIKCLLNIFNVLMKGLYRRGQCLIFFPDQYRPCFHFGGKREKAQIVKGHV